MGKKKHEISHINTIVNRYLIFIFLDIILVFTMPVFISSKKKSDEYCCRIFTMDAELQFTIEVSSSID